MKQIVIRRPGSFDRLEYVESPTPQPGPGQVLVAVDAAGVNFADVVVRLGLYPSAKEYVGWPITPGFEYSGRIVACGEGVTEYQVGQEVFGVSLFGAYTSHILSTPDLLFPIPEGVPLTQASVIPVAHLTAWYALFVLGAATEKKKVLVHSAAGGVGGALVQMAKAVGCFVVAVVGSSHKVETARSYGADVVIDKSREKIFERARQAVPGGFDIVFDANGYETLRQGYRALRPTGRLVIYGAHSMLTRGSGRPNWLKLAWTFLLTPRFFPLDLTNDNKSVLAFNLSYLFEERDLLQQAMDQILNWIRSGALRLPELTEFPLRQAGEAHAQLQSGQTVGKVVLRPEHD